MGAVVFSFLIERTAETMNLKEYLANKPDAREQDVNLTDLDITVRIRRLSVGERKRLYAAHKLGTEKADVPGLNAELVAISVMPALTMPEVEDMTVIVFDAILEKINEFNGWSKKGVAELADQFRPTA